MLPAVLQLLRPSKLSTDVKVGFFPAPCVYVDKFQFDVYSTLRRERAHIVRFVEICTSTEHI